MKISKSELVKWMRGEVQAGRMKRETALYLWERL